MFFFDNIELPVGTSIQRKSQRNRRLAGLNLAKLISIKNEIMKYLITILFAVVIIPEIHGQSDNQFIVASTTLNVRSGPGTNYDIVATLSSGDAVSLIEKKQSGWWLVEYANNVGYVFSQYLEIDPLAGWESKDYRTGVTPECENVSPQYDFNIDNFLRVTVGSNTDVVVRLMQINNWGDLCIRVVYVRSGDTFSIKNIPEGRYYLKIAYGKDYRQKKLDNQCYIKFMKNAHYEKGTDILDYYKVKQPDKRIGNEVYENWIVPSFELILDVLSSDNRDDTFKSKNISEKEFNK
jgi:hypothetical protein